MTKRPTGKTGSICEMELAAGAPAKSRERYTVLAICAFLIVAVGLVFGEAIRFGFVEYDDGDYVVKNVVVRKGITGEGIRWALTTFHAANWHPVTWFSHMVDCEVFGRWAGGHHLTSILLHAANAVLLFLVLRRMTAALWPSAFVAAVFAVHPLRVESVVWVSERKDVLSGLFFMLTLWAYSSYARSAALPGAGRHRRTLWYLAVVVFSALGLMSKPMLVTLPFVLLLLDFWPLERMEGITPQSAFSRLGWLALEKLPLLIMSAASCVVTPLAQGRAVSQLEDLSFGCRLANAIVSYVAYLRLSVWPVGLTALYPHPNDGLPAWEVVAALLVLVAISTAVIILWRKCPYLFTGWFWYVGMLVPAIGLMQVGRQAMADRYTYLPQIGIGIAVAWGIAYVARSWTYRRLVFGVGSALLLVEFMVCAWVQTFVWQDTETLWTHALKVNELNSLAHSNLGCALTKLERYDEAMPHFQRACEIEPSYAEAQNNLGQALAQLGRQEEAMVHFRKALQTQPDAFEAISNLGNALSALGQLDEAVVKYRKALELRPDSAEAYNNLGCALRKLGRMQEAKACYRKALKLRPDYVDALNNYGSALFMEGRLEESAQQYRETLKNEPRNPVAHAALGIVLGRAGKLDEAISELQQALEIKPSDASSHNNLGFAFMSRGQDEKALAHFRMAVAIRPNDAQAYDNLGLVLTKLRRWEEAAAAWRKAVELQPNYVQAIDDLSWLLATCPEKSVRNGEEAIRLARRAVELTGGEQARSLDALGAAYAETGRFVDALAFARKALDVATRLGDTVLAGELKNRIAIYEAKQAYRQQ